MQPKTIEYTLKRKLKDWLDSIDNQSLVEKISKDVICSGGAIANMLEGIEINDYDFYFKTKETTLAVAKYYLDKFKKNPPSRFKDSDKLVEMCVIDDNNRIKIIVKSQGIAGENGNEEYQYFEQVDDPSEPEAFVHSVVKDKEEADKKGKKNKYRPIFLTSNAISLSGDIQIVIRFYGSAGEIHRNFDFVHCTCSFDFQENRLNLPNNALISLLNKRLKYKGNSKYPLCSIIRTRKFLSRGWHIDAGQYVKMAWDLNLLDLSNIKVLEDQMVGVDSAYFREVIDMLKEKDGKVDGTYLMQIIDKVFG